MNGAETMKRGYSRQQLEQIGFDRNKYRFPVEPGKEIGTLVMKEWGKRECLMCYFDTDSGAKLILSVWADADEDNSYRPKNSDIDMSRVELGSRMKITYELTSSGKSRFLDAVMLNEAR